MTWCVCRVTVQLDVFCFLSLLCGSQGLKSGPNAWHQVPVYQLYHFAVPTKLSFLKMQHVQLISNPFTENAILCLFFNIYFYLFIYLRVLVFCLHFCPVPGVRS